MTRVAAVDCGTNTIRLLIADLIRDGAGRAHLEPLRRRNEIVRLGQGVDRTGMLDPEALPKLMAAGTIEVAPLAYMRGRTLNDAFVILDEAQNTSPEQMKMFLPRLGFGSRMVVTGLSLIHI